MTSSSPARTVSPQARKLALLQTFGKLANVIDTNLRAQSGDKDAFVDLISIGETYPLLGRIDSPQLPSDAQPFAFLSRRDGNFGALVDPLMLDQLGAEVGDVIAIGGTPFEVRGVLAGVPDGAVRGFRLGLHGDDHHHGVCQSLRSDLAVAGPRHLVSLQALARWW